MMSITTTTLRLNNIAIESRSSDKFINATQMCKAGGKRLKNWYVLESTKELIKTLKNNLESEGKILPSLEIKLIDVKRGNSSKFSQGSWIHPDLAVQLAQWISPSFAIQVSRWIRELFLTGNVSIDSNKNDDELKALQNEVMLLKTENIKIQEENKNKDVLIESKDAALNRLHNTQKELLSYKKRMTKNETIYIVSTKNYAQQGIYKIGRTNGKMKVRLSGHNNTHIAGDKVEVLKQLKVNDATLVERNIYIKLNGLLVEGEKEFFMCPFNQLVSITEAIVRNDDEENKLVSSIIELVYTLKNQQFNPSDWMAGIPEDAFIESNAITIQQVGQAPVVLDTSTWSDQHKKEFINRCIQGYVEQQGQVDQDYQMLWKTFQRYVFQQLAVPRSKFKATEWKQLVKTCVDEKEKLSIKWRV
jgi:hypothetical protein